MKQQLTGQEQSEQDKDRRSRRAPLQGEVTVVFNDTPLFGSGENISSAGVYFITDEHIQVKVRLEGYENLVDARLVRVESMGEGKTGIAVKFEEGSFSPKL